jgi:hypothetical protein
MVPLAAMGGGGTQNNCDVTGAQTLLGSGVDVTGPLNTDCGVTRFVLHSAAAWVVQFDTHFGVAQSRLHDVVHAAMQFFAAS